MCKIKRNLCKINLITKENAMLFTEIKPFIRYARYMELERASYYPKTKPCDSRLFYAKDGEGAIYADGRTYSMKKGDVIIFGAGCEYKICPGNPHIKYVVLNFDYSYAHSDIKKPVAPKPTDEFTDADVIERADFTDGEIFNGVLYLEGMHAIGGELEEIEREYSKKLLHYEVKISGSLTEVLTQCIRSALMVETPGGEERLEEIIKYIHREYRNSITNRSIGELFGFHPNYISSLMRKYTGMPLHKYLLSVRIARSAELLGTTSMPIGEIAERCGFCDIYYFSRYFKESMGLSAHEYRKKNIGI